jgi:hypothetical protein
MKIKINKIVNKDFETERILLEVIEDCNLSHYLLFDKTYDENGIESNKHRHMFIFGALDLKKGDFVSLYTRGNNGSDKKSFTNIRGTTTYKLFWGLIDKIWNNDADTAYLVHYDDWMSKDAN